MFVILNGGFKKSGKLLAKGFHFFGNEVYVSYAKIKEAQDGK